MENGVRRDRGESPPRQRVPIVDFRQIPRKTRGDNLRESRGHVRIRNTFKSVSIEAAAL